MSASCCGSARLRARLSLRVSSRGTQCTSHCGPQQIAGEIGGSDRGRLCVDLNRLSAPLADIRNMTIAHIFSIFRYFYFPTPANHISRPPHPESPSSSSASTAHRRHRPSWSLAFPRTPEATTDLGIAELQLGIAMTKEPPKPPGGVNSWN